MSVAGRGVYADPADYEARYAGRSDDVEMYLRIARAAQGPVLEYGVGNGRVALALAEAGVSVTGVDVAPAMTAHLRRKLGVMSELRGSVRVRTGDMRQLRLRERFALVIAPFNVVLHLGARRDFERFFARVRGHLLPGASFVFDFELPSMAALALAAKRGNARRGDVWQPVSPGLRTPQRLMQVLPGGRALDHRVLFPREVDCLLRYNGLVPVKWLADFGREPLHGDAQVAVVHCRDADS